MPEEEPIDFTDRAYQVKLPMHARSTATQAVKNNLRDTELLADKNIILGQQKVRCSSTFYRAQADIFGVRVMQRFSGTI